MLRKLSVHRYLDAGYKGPQMTAAKHAAGMRKMRKWKMWAAGSLWGGAPLAVELTKGALMARGWQQPFRVEVVREIAALKRKQSGRKK